MLSLVAVKFKPSTETTAVLSQGHNQIPKDSSPVMMLEMKVELSLACSLRSVQTALRFSFLITVHQSWHKFFCIVPHVELIQQNLLARSIQQSSNVANVMYCSSLVFRIPSCTFTTFPVMVPVRGRPECSSSSADICLFLKHFKAFVGLHLA